MSDFEIFILAGGKSSRMGEDKGLMTLFGKPMIQYVLDEVEKLGVTISIISNNPSYKKFGLAVYKDKINNVGPLGGIHSALLRSEANSAVILSCDTPYVTKSLILELLKKKDHADVVIPTFDGQIHPLIAVYDKKIVSYIETQILKNNLKITDVIEGCELVLFDANNFEKIVFKNLNSKGDMN